MISICFTSKLFGARFLRPIIKSPKTEQTAFLLITGKIFEEDLNCLNLILFFNVITGNKMNFLKHQTMDVPICTSVPMLTGLKKFITQTHIRPQSANLESIAKRFIALSSTLNLRKETQFPKDLCISQIQEVVINKKICFLNSSLVIIKNCSLTFNRLFTNQP